MATSGLGSLLVDEGLLSEIDRRTIRDAASGSGAAFAKSVVALGLLQEDELAAFIAERTEYPVAPKEWSFSTSERCWNSIEPALQVELEVVPINLSGNRLTVAMVDPLDASTTRQIEFFTGYKVQPVIATIGQLRSTLKQRYQDFEPKATTLEAFLANHAATAAQQLAATEQPSPLWQSIGNSLAYETEAGANLDFEPKVANPAIVNQEMSDTIIDRQASELTSIESHPLAFESTDRNTVASEGMTTMEEQFELPEPELPEPELPEPELPEPELPEPRIESLEAHSDQHIIGRLNHTLMELASVENTTDRFELIQKAFKESGLPTGIFYHLVQSSTDDWEVEVLSSWLPANGPQHPDHLQTEFDPAAFKPTGLGKILSRLYPGWTPLRDSMRIENFSELDKLVPPGGELLGTAVPYLGGQLCLIAGWSSASMDRNAVRSMTLDILRNFAKRESKETKING